MDKSNIQVEKIDIEQQTKEWLELRKKSLTASDARLLLLFFDKNITRYYSNDVFSLTTDKLKSNNNISDYKKKLFREGHIAEELIAQKLKNELFKYSKYKLYHGIIIRCPYTHLMASLDILIHDTHNDSYHIYEIKNCNSKAVLDKYEQMLHENYYQVAFQLYLLKNLYPDKNITASIVTHDMQSNELKRFPLNEDTEYYKAVEKYIQQLIDASLNINFGVEALLSSKTGDEDKELIKKYTYSYLDNSEKMKELKAENDKIKSKIGSLIAGTKFQDKYFTISHSFSELYKKILNPKVEAILKEHKILEDEIYIDDLSSMELKETIIIKKRKPK